MNCVALCFQLLWHKSSVSGSGYHCRRLHRCHRLLLPDKGSMCVCVRESKSLSASNSHCVFERSRVYKQGCLWFPFQGGLHQVPGPLLCPRDCNVCDRNHHMHCAVLQICELRKYRFLQTHLFKFSFGNDCLLLQIPWLHMLYAAMGAIAFTLVSILLVALRCNSLQ